MLDSGRVVLEELLGGAALLPARRLVCKLDLRTEAELDRLIDELRRRVLHELGAGHRVRLK